VNYEPENHQLMVQLRQSKVDKIADSIPEQQLDSGPSTGKILVVGWGSTYGAIKSAVAEWQTKGAAVSHLHLRHIRPFPRNLGTLLRQFDQLLVPEINNGQLIRILRDEFLVDAKGYNKIMGIPITKTELVMKLEEMLSA
jgi:2-oxoglutarate ferredoxin oxidoreductase subunit alpha